MTVLPEKPPLGRAACDRMCKIHSRVTLPSHMLRYDTKNDLTAEGRVFHEISGV